MVAQSASVPTSTRMLFAPYDAFLVLHPHSLLDSTLAGHADFVPSGARPGNAASHLLVAALREDFEPPPACTVLRDSQRRLWMCCGMLETLMYPVHHDERAAEVI